MTTITPKDFDHAEGATRYGYPAEFLAPLFIRNGEVFANSRDLAEALWIDPAALHSVIAEAVDGEPDLTRGAFVPITHLVDPHGDDQSLAPAVKTYEISVFGLGLLVPHMPTLGDTRGRLICATNQAVAAATKLREEQQ